jgi:hypothetical protein
VAKRITPSNVERLVEHMFDQVFGEEERAELLACIHEWEAANPDVDPAHRVTGWIDVAYLYQAGLNDHDHGRVFREYPSRLGIGWSLAPALG